MRKSDTTKLKSLPPLNNTAPWCCLCGQHHAWGTVCDPEQIADLSRRAATADLPGYTKGAGAFWIGKDIDANPYSWREVARQNWHAGWMEARAEAVRSFNEERLP